MRAFKLAVVTGVLVLAGGQTMVRGQQRTGAPQRAVPGQVIVKFRANAAAHEKAHARGRVAAAAVGELTRSSRAGASGSIELVRIPAGSAVQSALAALRADAAVEYAEPNWIYTHQAAPNDQWFAQQWALQNTGQPVGGLRGTPGADIDAPRAWDTAAGAPTVYIGVVDEGIDYNHPDLGAQPGGAIWTNPYDPLDGIDNDGNGYADDLHGWDFDANDNSVFDGTPFDRARDSHGTHVAGILGARTNNSIGVAGVAPGVVIIPAKFLGVDGGTTAHAVLALDYLTDLKVRHNLNIVATNNSWTGGGFSQALLEAIGRAARHDILFIAAAGNGASDELADDIDAFPSYPANYDTTGIAGYDAVISVTATGQSDEMPVWANYGFTAVDLAAPGALIISTTPHSTYTYSSGTSMAVPHVSGAAALVHTARGLSGRALKEAILSEVDPAPALAGRSVTGGRLNLARAVRPAGGAGGGSTSSAAEIVMYAARAQTVTGNWSIVQDATAAGGARIQSGNLGAAKVTMALASPRDFFELAFQAEAGRPYHLWVRARAENNGWANDSVHVQFDGAVTAGGSPAYRVGTTSSAEVNLEDCSGCGVSGWGWQDNGYGAGVSGAPIYFQTSGPQRLRVQIREDGVGIDQIVLSSGLYLSSSPGLLKLDASILADGAPAPAPPAADEITLYAAAAGVIAGEWSRVEDGTAAGGARLQNPNAAAPKIVTALAQPSSYFEMTFTAEAGKSYRLWLRGKALGNSWANDSVHVQFSDSVTATNLPVYRIGTSSSAEVNLEDCSSCGVAGWGWQDNGYGAGVLGPEIRFAAAGTHTIRVQVREDGLGIDQIVLSAGRYLTSPPGLLRNDTTILGR